MTASHALMSAEEFPALCDRGVLDERSELVRGVVRFEEGGSPVCTVSRCRS